MLYEYAVEPACLGEWQNFKYLIEQFGVSKGRLVAKFPKDWPKRVILSCNNFSFTQKARLEIELNRLKKHGLVRSGRPYDGSKDWVANALSQFSDGFPFHAVIVNSIAERPEYVLLAEELNHGLPRWTVRREKSVPRTAEALGEAVAGLLQISEHIIFVDKFFDPVLNKWQKSLQKFIELATKGREKIPILEFHTGIHNDEFGKTKDRRLLDFQEICNQHLSGLIPEKVSLKIVRWDQAHRGDFFHYRCILTDKGGIRIDWGLDTGDPGETTLVSIFEDETWLEVWLKFQTNSTSFEFVDSVSVVGANKYL